MTLISHLTSFLKSYGVHFKTPLPLTGNMEQILKVSKQTIQPFFSAALYQNLHFTYLKQWETGKFRVIYNFDIEFDVIPRILWCPFSNAPPPLKVYGIESKSIKANHSAWLCMKDFTLLISNNGKQANLEFLYDFDVKVGVVPRIE